MTCGTRESILLCEAAGFDWIVVETVGVGQQEADVASMTDFYLLVFLPNAGDELQGIKRGVLELADGILVNKMDTDETAARRSQAELRAALTHLRPRTPEWQVPVLTGSAQTGAGLNQLDRVLEEFRSHTERGIFLTRRRGQNRDWVWELAREQLLREFENDPKVQERSKELDKALLDGAMDPHDAASELLRGFRSRE